MNLQVGVKVLLRNAEGRYLFLRRSQEMDHGGEQVWDIPGGRIEPSEPLVDALVREVKEETGLLLNPNIELIAAQDIFVTAKDLHVIRLTYIGSAEGLITLSDEHDASSWMSKTEILQQPNLDRYLSELEELL